MKADRNEEIRQDQLFARLTDLPTDLPTDTARCRVVCPRLKTFKQKFKFRSLAVIIASEPNLNCLSYATSTSFDFALAH